ncbi:lytic transglycosylase [Hypericibacter terrae]|uniref:Lytic transglycosylase n=1 Tax=Hypericibacter terrae TaxID=2602015 RepID=A0A5J6MH09_9PROT|nr:lytic transglycosylase domain-containing protein [Hypericibacter terrae]QEX16719.1 lytic transglycosylase [Hypericibacter terrae]
MRGTAVLQRLFLLVALIAGASVLGHGVAEAKLLSGSDKAIYIDAFKQVDKQNWAKAREIAQRAKEKLPAKMIQWLDLIRPGPGRSFDEITRFMRDNPDWPGQISLQQAGERAMPADYGIAETLAWFKGRKPQTIEGTIALGRAYAASGLRDDAARVVRAGWIELSINPDKEQAYLDQFGSFLRPQDHLARLDHLLWAGDADDARRAMARVDDDHRKLAEARIRLMTGGPNVDNVVAAVPKSLQNDPGLIYDRARFKRRNDDDVGAAALLDPPPPTNPYPVLMWKEYEYAARHALERGDISVAYRLAEAHGADDGAVFADGEFLAGWIALRFLNEFKTGYDHFTRLYAGVGSAISKGRGAYWAGRAAEEMGEKALAQEWYKKAAESLSSYYGQLAAQRLGTADGLSFPRLPKITNEGKAKFEKLELVRLVRMLGELDEADRCRSFLLRLTERAKEPAEYRMIADLADDIGRRDYGVAVAKQARTQGVELLDYLYPMQALPAGDNPEDALILAVIRQESAFDQKATSSAGALGLMQLMPRTAKQIAKKLQLPYSDAKLTKDPSYNIKLGRAYLGDLVNGFDGSYILAIASYNAGPARVQSWMSEFGDPRDRGVDAIDWIETIPFSETRNYVQRVLENLQVYRHRLNGKTEIALSLEQDLGRSATP